MRADVGLPSSWPNPRALPGGGGCRKPNRPVKGGQKIERQNEVAQWLPEPNPRAVLWGEDAMLSPNGAMGAVCLCRMGPSLQSKMHGQEHG